LEESRLLGVIVINQIIRAVDTLINNGWQGVYYLYMDEAARFATPQIDQVLSYKRKSGLRLVLAHHYFEQFDDKKVLNSIMNNARIKFMFDTPSYEDRMKMVKALGYGGDIPHLLANFANQNIPKQYAIVKKNKETPVRIRIPDVDSLPKAGKKYIQKILDQPFYQDARSLPKDLKRSKPRKTSNQKTDQSDSLSGRGSPSIVENFKKSKSAKKRRNTEE
jgi:hypothetical protein